MRDNCFKTYFVAGLLLLIQSMFALEAAGQQQPFTFTQYMNNQVPFNPAYSLINNVASINTMARKQWVGIDGAPTTFLANANIPFRQINASAGLIVINDQFAIENETEVNAYFAKAIQLGENQMLSVSLNAGLRSYDARYSSLDSTDPSFKNDIRETKPNVGFGILYFTDWYYAGISAPELTITTLGTASVQNNNNFKDHYYFTGGMITKVDEDIKFKPATLISIAGGVPVIANISGTFYLKDEIGIGFNYATNKEMAGIITFDLNNFHIGYSYQFSTSSNNLGGFNVPTHEVTFSYRFGAATANTTLL